MSAVVITFPDRRGNRPVPLNPPQDVVTKVRAYCWKLGLNNIDRRAVMGAVNLWQRSGIPDRDIAARGMAMANNLHYSHTSKEPA